MPQTDYGANISVMQDFQPDLVEKYQILLQKDPKSQVFAPLTEAYRKMGLIEEAFRIAVRGVQFNPHFSGGRIALAKVFLDRENLASAIEELEKAVEISPDNILAHATLGDCYLKSRQPKEALRAFKMVLFLSPNHEKAIKAVQKLESLTADEYEDELFEMKKLGATEIKFNLKNHGQDDEAITRLRPVNTWSVASHLERMLSLIDAFIVRNDMEKAIETIQTAEEQLGSHPELVKRMRLVRERTLEESEPTPENSQNIRRSETLNSKIDLLQSLLERLKTKSY